MDAQVAGTYGNRLRVRACGLCLRDDKLLMVNHQGLSKGNLWAPPGGGIDFGATIAQTVAREFLEETGLVVRPVRFLFGCEFIQAPLHSLELFYSVEIAGGELRVGNDPELPIISQVRFLSFQEIKEMPVEHVHGIFRLADSLADFNKLSGFYAL